MNTQEPRAFRYRVTSYPLVSVLIPAYNADRYLEESLLSVLNQNYPNVEILVMDDGSTDGTWDVLRKFRRDARLRIFKSCHRGIGATRNELLRLSRGRMVAFHDADDLMLPGRLRKQVDVLCQNPNLDGVYGDVIAFREDPSRVCLSLCKGYPYHRERDFVPDIAQASLLIRKKSWAKAGPYASHLFIGEDTHWLIRFFQKAHVHYKAQPTYLYRIHSKSMTHTNPHRTLAVREAAILSAVQQLNQKKITRLTVKLFEVRIKIKTNSSVIHKALGKFLDASAIAKTHPIRYDFQCYEVSSIKGIYDHIKFGPPKRFAMWHEDKKSGTLTWKVPSLGLVGKIYGANKLCVIFVETGMLKSMSGYTLLEHMIVYPLAYLLRPKGLYFFHAATVSGNEGACLLAGPPFSGKTTLSLELMRQGYRLLSDEISILQQSARAVTVRSFPRKIQIKDASFDHFPELRKRRRQMTRIGTDKWILSASLLGQRLRVPSSTLRVIIVLEYQPKCVFSIRPIQPAEWLAMIRNHGHGYLTFGCDDILLLECIAFFKAAYHKVPIYKCRYSDRHRNRLLQFINLRLKAIEENREAS